MWVRRGVWEALEQERNEMAAEINVLRNTVRWMEEERRELLDQIRPGRDEVDCYANALESTQPGKFHCESSLDVVGTVEIPAGGRVTIQADDLRGFEFVMRRKD